jgi:hypothetical protein
MTEATSGTPLGVKTLGIKLPDDVHAQLVLIAQLDGLSLTDAIRQAIDFYIERRRTEGDLAGRASQALAEIERDAAMRRDALKALFGPSGPTAPAIAPTAATAAEAEAKASGRRGREQAS